MVGGLILKSIWNLLTRFLEGHWLPEDFLSISDVFNFPV